jgi:hypothetical protein
MPELTWLDSQVGSLEQGIELINRFYWNIEIQELDQEWVVKGGELVLLRAENKDSVDAFLYGMALAYSVFPEEFIERF